MTLLQRRMGSVKGGRLKLWIPLIHTWLGFDVAQNLEGCQGNVHNKEKRMNAHGIQPLVKPNYFVIEVSSQSDTSKILCLLHVLHKSGENIQNYSLKENTHVFLLCTLLLQHTLSTLVAQE